MNQPAPPETRATHTPSVANPTVSATSASPFRTTPVSALVFARGVSGRAHVRPPDDASARAGFGIIQPYSCELLM